MMLSLLHSCVTGGAKRSQEEPYIHVHMWAWRFIGPAWALYRPCIWPCTGIVSALYGPCVGPVWALLMALSMALTVALNGPSGGAWEVVHERIFNVAFRPKPASTFTAKS
jgi:hypothetical protein